MKNLILTFALTLLTALSFGQDAINYQGVCSTTNGPVANQNISVAIDIIDSTTVGPIVYSETHSVTTNDKGLFSIEIGNGTSTFQTFDTVNFASPTFMSIGVDTLGGSSYVTLGTSQFLSVPNALYSQCAGEVLTKEVDQSDYNSTGGGTITIQLDPNVENELMDETITVFVYDASGAFLIKTTVQYGFPTSNEMSITNPLVPGATKYVFYLETINGLQKITFE